MKEMLNSAVSSIANLFHRESYSPRVELVALWELDKKAEAAFTRLLESVNSPWDPINPETVQSLSDQAKTAYPDINEIKQPAHEEALVQFADSIKSLDPNDARVLTWQAYQDGKKLVSDFKDLPENVDPQIIVNLMSRIRSFRNAAKFLPYWRRDKTGNSIDDKIGNHMHLIGKHQHIINDFALIVEDHQGSKQANVAKTKIQALFPEYRQPLTSALENYLKFYEAIAINQPEQISLVNIVNQVGHDYTEMLRYYGFSARITLTETRSINEIYQTINPSPLSRIMHNIIHNVIEHSGIPKIKLQPFLWIGANRDNVFRFIVADNGTGFPNDFLKTDENGVQKALLRGVSIGGTGIGLATVADDVKELGGNVKLINGRDIEIKRIGAVVIIDLPLPLPFLKD